MKPLVPALIISARLVCAPAASAQTSTATAPASTEPPTAESTAFAPAPQSNATGGLGFDQALATLVAKSLSVRTAAVELEIARERARSANDAYLPSATAVGSERRSWPQDDATSRERALDLTAEINLYRFGGDAARQDAAAAASNQAESSRAGVILAAEQSGALALLDIIAAEQELAIAKRLLATRQANLDMARKLYERGLRPIQDVEKVEIDADNEAAAVREAELAVAAARTSAQRLAGEALPIAAAWPWTAQLQAAAVRLDKVAAPPTPATHPEIGALAASVRQYEAEADAAAAAYWPSLDLAASYGIRSFAEDAAWRRGPSAALTLTAPIFDRFATRGAVRELRLRQLVATDVLANRQRELIAEWATARARFLTALTTAGSRDKSVTIARGLYDRSLKSFQAGVLSANELNLDQSRLYETERAAQASIAAAHRAWVDLCRAAGRRLPDCG